jgi:hypothetical protein
MAATLIDYFNARRHTALRSRTEAAILVYSRTVQLEGEGVTEHTKRLACANACFTSEAYLQQMVNSFMFDISTNATVAANPDTVIDGDISWIVADVYTTQALAHQPV